MALFAYYDVELKLLFRMHAAVGAPTENFTSKSFYENTVAYNKYLTEDNIADG